MKVVIAPDSFKDAMRAGDACERIAAGLRAVLPDVEIDRCPVADGGEGFTDAVTYGNPSAISHASWTTGPLAGDKIEPRWVMLLDAEGKPDTAVIELAAASGLERLKTHERDPTKTTTFGTGILIHRAIEAGARRILLGIGGSATNDAGTGIAFALSVPFLDSKGRQVFKNPPYVGGRLQEIADIMPGVSLLREEGIELVVACDVNNPLTGSNGAAHVYAPQKGATPEQVEQLDAGLRHLAQLWRDRLGIDVEQLPGAGAAGGVGGGLVAMLGAQLVPGAQLVLDTVGFDGRIKDADLVITGEGRLDRQSLSGKAAMAVAGRCAAAGVPCHALVGSVGEGADEALGHGLSGYRVIGQGLPPDESIRRTAALLEGGASGLARDLFS